MKNSFIAYNGRNVESKFGHHVQQIRQVSVVYNDVHPMRQLLRF